MAVKEIFTAEEWQTLSQAPYAAMVAIMAASPSGPMGMVQETLPLARSLSDIKANGSPSELVGALVGELTAEGATKPPAFGNNPEQAEQNAMQTLGLVGEMFRSKLAHQALSAGEADQFRGWLVTIAEGTAAAYKEGGFLGIGKRDISDQEREAVKNIRQLLDVAA